jgi:hypothetical protein
MQVQILDDSSFSGFVDDNRYSNLFGIGTKARAIDRNTAQIKADTEKLRAETDARIKALADQEKETQEKIRQAKELTDKLEESQYNIPTPNVVMQSSDTSLTQGQNQIPQDSGNPLASIPKPVLIGGGVILALVVVLLIVRR